MCNYTILVFMKVSRPQWIRSHFYIVVGILFVSIWRDEKFPLQVNLRDLCRYPTVILRVFCSWTLHCTGILVERVLWRDPYSLTLMLHSFCFQEIHLNFQIMMFCSALSKAHFCYEEDKTCHPFVHVFIHSKTYSQLDFRKETSQIRWWKIQNFDYRPYILMAKKEAVIIANLNMKVEESNEELKISRK